MRDGLTWFGRRRASLSRRLSRSSHASVGGGTSLGSAHFSSPGGRMSSSGGVSSGGGASPRPRASACTSHVHLGLVPSLPSPGPQPLAAPQPGLLPSGVDVLRDVPYADAATLPLASEDSFSEGPPAQEATLSLGAPLSAPAAAPHALVPDSPRVQVALSRSSPPPPEPDEPPQSCAPPSVPKRASKRASISSLYGSRASREASQWGSQSRGSSADRPIRRMRLRDQLELPPEMVDATVLYLSP